MTNLNCGNLGRVRWRRQVHACLYDGAGPEEVVEGQGGGSDPEQGVESWKAGASQTPLNERPERLFGLLLPILSLFTPVFGEALMPGSGSCDHRQLVEGIQELFGRLSTGHETCALAATS